MTRKTLPDFDAIFAAGADELAHAGFKGFSVETLAQSLDMPEDMAKPLFDDSYSFVASLIRYIDASVASAAQDLQSGSQEPARDRVFEVLMARFDEAQKVRGAILEIMNAAPRDPRLAALVAGRLPHSMKLMLELAGVLTTGRRQRLQVAGLCGLWLRTVRTWSKDDSEDMGKTMAALDKSLNDVNSIAGRLF